MLICAADIVSNINVPITSSWTQQQPNLSPELNKSLALTLKCSCPILNSLIILSFVNWTEYLTLMHAVTLTMKLHKYYLTDNKFSSYSLNSNCLMSKSFFHLVSFISFLIVKVQIYVIPSTWSWHPEIPLLNQCQNKNKNVF